MQLYGKPWEDLLAAVRNGDKKEFSKNFEACLGFDLRPVFKYGAKQARAYILQKISDAAGPSGSDRDTAIEPRFRRMLLPYLVYRDFTEGRDIVKDLEDLADHLELAVLDSDYDAALMGGALSVFCGRADLLARFGKLPALTRGLDLFNRPVYETCFLCFTAFLNEKPVTLQHLAKVAYFPGFMGEIARPFEKFHMTHLRLPALELFAYNAADTYLAGCPVSGNRQIKDVALSCEEYGRLLGMFSDHLDRGFFIEAEKFNDKLSGEHLSAQAFTAPQGPSDHAVSYLNCALTALCSEDDGELLPGDTRKYIASAEKALAAGMPVFAALLAGTIRIAPAVLDRADDVLSDVAMAYGFRPPFKAIPKRPKWENALDEIDKFLSANQTSGADGEAAPGVLYWQLNIEPVEGDDGMNILESVSARIRKPLKSGKLNKGRIVEAESVADGRINVETTPEDLRILAILQKQNYGYSYSYAPFAGDRSHITELAQALVGHPRLCVKCYDGREEPWEEITLSSHTLSIETERNGAGDLILTLPLGADSRSAAYIRKDAAGAYSLAVADKRLYAVAQLVLKYGSGFQLIIPAESVPAASRRLVGIAKQVPVSGAISADGDSAGFPHFPVNPTPHARISFTPDDVMQVDLRIAMGSGKDGRVIPPGEGNAEVVARKDGSPVVFIRALDEETDRADAVAKLIQSQGKCEEAGPYSWFVPALGDALAVLDALKHHPDALPIDWLDPDRALKLTSLANVALDAQSKGIDHWLGVSGSCKLDDGRVVAFEEMLRALPSRSGNYVRLDNGDYIRVTGKLRDKLELIASAGEVKNGGVDICDAALPSIADALEDKNGDGETDCRITLPEILLRRADEIREELSRDVRVPATLKADLRPYQLEGYTWLAHLASCGIGACLADDMGLGKTLEVISVLLEKASRGASLVIAPTSVCGNWVAEIRRFAPALNPVPFGQCADPASAVAAAGAFDVVIASYGLAMTRRDILAGRDWNGVVLDEAQAIKNAAAKRAKAVKRLSASFKIAATGTPVENRLSEFWSIFDFLNPGMLLSQEKFIARYTTDGRATDKLKKLVSPLILRRLKKDVLLDLPEKTEINLDVELGETEREAYEACRRMALERIENQKSAKSGQPGMAVLAELTKLRRFCCHPSLVIPEMTVSAKLEALEELLSSLNEGGHRALIFSQYTDYLAIVRAMLEKKGWSYKYLDGATPAAERGDRVAAFQNGEGDFFLISLKAGGFGLNLTAANYVILLDPWWNPAVERQAADRVHRIGQKEPVTVYRLVTKDTIEERVVELHNDKLEIAEDLLEGTASSKLTTEEMLGLFR